MTRGSVLSSREIATLIKGLESQGATVTRTAGDHYKITPPSGSSVTLSLGSSDRQQILGAKTKLRRLGLSWPLDPPPVVRKSRTKVVSEIPAEAVVAAKEKAERAEAAIKTAQPAPAGRRPVVKTKASTVMEEWIDLTSALAEKLLSHNTSNRPLRPLHVDELARDMAAGNWVQTGDSIKFDVNDILIDGQHRLAAVVKSKVTIRVMLIIGLEPEARGVIDTNSRRSASDALGFAGVEKYRAPIAGAARIALTREQGVWQTALDMRNPKFTNTEIVGWVDDNPGVYTAAEIASRTYKAVGATPSAWVYCVYELMQVDLEQAQEFVYSLAEYRTDGPGDPRLALLNALRTANETRGRVIKNPEMIFLVFRAWNAWRASQPAHKFSPSGKGAVGGSAIPKPI
jgi:hypothetical protein